MKYPMSDREFEFFSQLIYRINSLSGYENVAQTLLNQLKYIVPFNKGLVSRFQEVKPGKLQCTGSVVINPPGVDFDEDIYNKGHYNSLWHSYTLSPWSNTIRGTDMRDETAFLSSPLYRDVYEPQGIYYSLQTVLIYQDMLVSLLSIFRPKSDGDFSDRDMFILKSLAPHLALKFYNEIYSSSNSNIPVENSYSLQDRKLQFKVIQKFGLTKRESEILLLLCDGMQNQELLSELFISKSTLDKHLNSIYRKMGVKNRTQAVFQTYALREIID